MKKKLVLYILIFLSILNTNLLADITSNLVVHYEFENNSIEDSSGNNHNLTISGNGNPHHVSGKIGDAYSFNGSDNYLELSSIPTESNGTISFWMNTSSFQDQTFINSHTSGTQNITIENYATGNYQLSAYDGNYNQRPDSAPNIHDGNWHHIVLTFNGQDTGKFYIDGTQYTMNPDENETFILGTELSIGHKNNGNAYSGLMDDIRIYSRALTSSDVTELFDDAQPKLTLKNHGGVIQINDAGSMITTTNTVDIGSVTLESWVKTSQANGDIIKIVYQGTYTTLSISNSSFTLDVVNVDNGPKSFYTNTDINDSVWHHVAASFDNTNNTLKIYINGVEQSLTASMDYDQTGFSLLNGIVTLGGDDFSSAMDEVRIWDTVRTSTQIKDNFNHQLDGNETGLVAYYNFDERVGDTVYDISSNHINGTIEGNVTRLNFLGDGLNFDGIDNNITSNLNIDLSNKSFSWGFWSYYNEAVEHDYVLRIGEETTNNGFNIGLRTDKKFRFSFFNNNLDYIEEESFTKQWIYWSGTYDTDSNITIRKLYKNGNLVAEDSNITDLVANDPLVIGTSFSNTDNMKGYIEEVSIWDKTLSGNEINNNMYSSLKGDENGLLGYWPLNEGAGTTAYDRSSNNNNGTITGATWVDTAPTIYGNTIYTSQNIATIHKLTVENNTSLPTYSFNGSVPSEVVDFNGTTGTFAYINTQEINTTLDINASDGGTSLNTSFNVVFFDNNITSESNTTNILHLENIAEFSTIEAYEGNTSIEQSLPYSIRFVTLKETSNHLSMYQHEQIVFETNNTITEYTYYDSDYAISDKVSSDENFIIDSSSNIITISDKHGDWADIKIIDSIDSTQLQTLYSSYGHNITFQSISKADIALVKHKREEVKLFGYTYSDQNGTEYSSIDMSNFATIHQTAPFYQSEINSDSYLVFTSNNTINEIRENGTIINQDIGTYEIKNVSEFTYDNNGVDVVVQEYTDVLVITLNHNATNYFEKRIAYAVNPYQGEKVQKGEYYAIDEVEKHLFLNRAAKDSIHNYYVKVPSELNIDTPILSLNSELQITLPTTLNSQTVTYNYIESRNTDKLTASLIDSNLTLKLNSLSQDGSVTLKLVSTTNSIDQRQYLTAKIVSNIYVDLNISNLNTSETTIDSILLIGEDNETIIFDKSSLTNGNNSLSSVLTNLSQNYMLKVTTTDSKTWWYNFADDKLYSFNNNDDFIFNFDGQDNIAVNFAPTQWDESNDAPFVFVFDRYIDKGFSNFSIDINITDPNKNDLRYKIDFYDPSDLISNTSTDFTAYIPYETYNTTSETLQIIKNADNNNTGKVKCTITLEDGIINIPSVFYIVVNNYISKESKQNISSDDYNNSSALSFEANNTIYSTQEDIYKKYNFGTNIITINSYKFNDDNTITNNQVVDTEGSVNPIRSDNSYYTIQNNIISIYSDSSLSTKIKEMKLVNLLTDQDLYDQFGIQFTNTNAKAYKFYEMYLTPTLNLYEDVFYYDYHYTNTSTNDALDEFISDAKKDAKSNTMGPVRDDNTNSTMLFLDNGTSSGNLLHIDENENLLSTNPGTWSIENYENKNVLVLYPTDTSYDFNYGTAFAVGANSNIQRGQYFKENSIATSIYLNKEAMQEFATYYSPKPHITKEIKDGWTYVSLPSTMTVCDSSIQSILKTICDQNNTLESVFDDANISSVLKYSNGWSYWDKEDTVNEYYQMDKFSAISASDGVLVKSSAQTFIDLPYDMFNNTSNEFITLNQSDWFLSSVTEDKTVQEIETMIETQEDRSLKYILLFRDNEWMVYAPTNDAIVDNNITRISEIKKDESFWVFVD